MTTPKHLKFSLLSALLLVTATVAVPMALAQEGNETDDEDDARPGQGGQGQSQAQERRSGNASDDADDQADDRGRGGDALERRGPSERGREALAAAYDRCIEATNGSDRCERISRAGDQAKQARRAASACMNAQDAWEHRITLLELREKRIRDHIAEGNLSDNETAAFEGQIERIQTLQDKFLDKVEKCMARVDGLEARHGLVREYARGQAKVEVCHFDEETNETITLRIAAPALRAHLAHGDSEGPCSEDTVDDGHDAGNVTAEDDHHDGADGADDGSGDGTDGGADGGDEGSDSGDGTDGGDGNQTADP